MPGQHFMRTVGTAPPGLLSADGFIGFTGFLDFVAVEKASGNQQDFQDLLPSYCPCRGPAWTANSPHIEFAF